MAAQEIIITRLSTLRVLKRYPMAARDRVGLSEATRQRIQTTMLVERLQKHILGEVEMSQTQMRATEILLKKTLPDLSAVTVTGDADNPVSLILKNAD